MIKWSCAETEAEEAAVHPLGWYSAASPHGAGCRHSSTGRASSFCPFRPFVLRAGRQCSAHHKAAWQTLPRRLPGSSQSTVAHSTACQCPHGLLHHKCRAGDSEGARIPDFFFATSCSWRNRGAVAISHASCHRCDAHFRANGCGLWSQILASGRLAKGFGRRPASDAHALEYHDPIRRQASPLCGNT